MKKNKKLLIALIVCVCGFLYYYILLLIGGAGKGIKNTDSKGATIICFGDSLTFGYGVAPGEDYPARLSELLNTPVINLGIDGDSSTEAMKRIQADVLDRNPLLVIIEFGGNDFLRKVPLQTTVANISQMVDIIYEKGAMVAIVDISSGIFLSEYRKSFQKIASQKQAIFIPSVLNGIITNPEMKSDFLHPNTDGYRIIAERIYQGISRYLKENASLNSSGNKK